MKQFCILALVMLLGFVVRDLAPTEARGQSPTFKILGPNTVLAGSSVYSLSRVNPPVGWHQDLNLPPVPPTSLVYFDNGNGFAVTDTGEGWIDLGVGNWQSFGPVPGVVATKQSSWGAVKARYR